MHILAYYYKWGEKEILSLPIFKRQMYIKYIQRQVKAENNVQDETDYDEEL